MKIVINVIGLPGSGKTTFSDMLAARLGAARVNADFVRENINRGLGFSTEDRIEQALRIANITNLTLTGKNRVSIVDFVNPTEETRKAFTSNIKYQLYTVFMDTIDSGRFSDTNKLFVRPEEFDFIVDQWHDLSSLSVVADDFAHKFRTIINGSMRRYHIRFNTLCNQDETIPQKWRIFDVETGEERLARSFHIAGSQISPGRSLDQFGKEKWNIEILAALFWEGEHANFVSD